MGKDLMATQRIVLISVLALIWSAPLEDYHSFVSGSHYQPRGLRGLLDAPRFLSEVSPDEVMGNDS